MAQRSGKRDSRPGRTGPGGGGADLLTARWPADAEHIALAGERLRQGAIIAFPTDTLYAVGCRAQDPTAVRRLYDVKRRPGTQPVVLLVSSLEHVGKWAVVSPRAKRLMERFWPGPLTLVLRRRPGGPIIGAAGPTLAFRMPNHPVALDLLGGLKEPIASSSANRAGAPAPATADAVLAGLRQDLELVLDGGAAPLAQPSTILDLSGPPRILRQGAIPQEELLA